MNRSKYLCFELAQKQIFGKGGYPIYSVVVDKENYKFYGIRVF